MRAPVFALAASLLLSSCTYRPGGEQDGGRTPLPAGTGEARRGGTLVYAVADDAAILDPQITSQPSGFALVRATQRGLTAFPSASQAGTTRTVDPSTPVADLADGAPTVSADGLVYTFRLRDGVAFGPPADRALTAADVKAGIERAFTVHSPFASYLRVIAGAAEYEAGRAPSIAGIEATDARTVIIRLVRPANDLLWMLAHPSASAVPAGTGVAVAPAAFPASGPYRVRAVKPGKEISLVRNPAWKRESDPVRAAWVDEIVVQVGDADGADVTGEELDPPSNATPQRVDSGCVLAMFLSPIDERLRDVRVRAGIAAAIDRAAVLDAMAKAGGPAARPSAGLLPPGATGASDRAVRTPDPAAARASAEGLTLPLGRESSGPDAKADEAAAAAVERALAAAGIDVTAVRAADPASIYERYESGGVAAGLQRWCPDWPGRLGRTVIGALQGTGGAANYGRATDVLLDRLIAAATAERNPANLAAAWKAAEDRALALAGTVPIGFLYDDVPVSRRVRGFEPHPFFLRGDPTALWLAADGAGARPVH